MRKKTLRCAVDGAPGHSEGHFEKGHAVECDYEISLACASFAHHVCIMIIYIIYICAHTVYLYVYISNILHYIYIYLCVWGGATPVPKGYNQNSSVVRLSFNSLLAAGGDKVAAWLSPTKLHAVD